MPAVLAHALGAWTFLAGPLLRRGTGPWTLYALLAGASLALAATLGRSRPGAGAPFLGAAAAALPLAFLDRASGAVWIAAGAAVYALPVAARVVAIPWQSTARLCRMLVLAVLLPGSVTGLAAAACTRGPRVADVFEDGHMLLPASEYLRGEKPYRDIVPGHGLVSDGGLALVELRVFGDDYRGVYRGEKASGVLFWPAFYAIVAAATGSPGAAFAGLLLSFLFFPQYFLFRAMMSLWTLALAGYAARTRRRGAWIACGALLPLGLCIAVEFAAYAGVGVVVALVVARGRRSENARAAALGGAASAAAIALILALLGVLGGFLHATFVFLPELLPAYAIGFPKPVWLRDLAGLGTSLQDGVMLLYGFVALSVVLLGAFLPRAPRVGARGRAALPVAAWAVAAMLSVLERQHLQYPLLVMPIGLLLFIRWAADHRRWTSPFRILPAAALSVLVLARRPIIFGAIVAITLARPPEAPANHRALEAPPRARGALFSRTDAALVASTAEMLRRTDLRAGDTWFDFVGAPGLYYLFDRDCPIRYYEAGFYETEQAQREVIQAIATNPHVRVALVSGLWTSAIDGVPNDRRTPLVAKYLREEFRPSYREGDVEWWLRKESTGATSAGPKTSPPRPP